MMPMKPIGSGRVGKRRGAHSRAVGPGQVYSTVLGNALCGRRIAGVILWMVAARSYPDYDQYTCRLPGTDDPSSGDDSAAIACVLRYSQRNLALNDEGCQAPTAAA